MGIKPKHRALDRTTFQPRVPFVPSPVPGRVRGGLFFGPVWNICSHSGIFTSGQVRLQAAAVFCLRLVVPARGSPRGDEFSPVMIFDNRYASIVPSRSAGLPAFRFALDSARAKITSQEPGHEPGERKGGCYGAKALITPKVLCRRKSIVYKWFSAVPPRWENAKSLIISRSVEGIFPLSQEARFGATLHLWRFVAAGFYSRPRRSPASREKKRRRGDDVAKWPSPGTSQILRKVTGFPWSCRLIGKGSGPSCLPPPVLAVTWR